MFPATTYPKIRMDKFNRAELWHFSRFGFFRTFFRSSYLPQISSEKVATWSDCRFFNNKELLLVLFLDLAAIYASVIFCSFWPVKATVFPLESSNLVRIKILVKGSRFITTIFWLGYNFASKKAIFQKLQVADMIFSVFGLCRPHF